MIRGVHTMFYSSEPDEMRAFLRDKLGFPHTDVGEGWLIFEMPEHIRQHFRKLIEAHGLKGLRPEAFSWHGR